MAEIPLFNGGETVKTGGPGAPVMQRGPGGFRVSVSDVAADLSSPTMDLDAFSGEARGLQALGEAGQRAASTIMGYAEQRQRIRNFNTVAGAVAEMDTAENEFRLYKEQNPDESQWGVYAAQTVDRVRGQIMRKDVPQAVLDELAPRFDRWAANFKIRADIDATKQGSLRARDSIEGGIAGYVEDGNEDGAFSLVDQGVGLGVIWEGEAAKMKASIRDKVRAVQSRQVYDENLGEIQIDPQGWAERNETLPPGMDPSVYERLRGEARSEINYRTNAALDQAVNDIASGNLTLPEEIDAMDDPYLSPALKAELKGSLAKINDAQMRAFYEDPANRNALFDELLQRANGWSKHGEDAHAEFLDILAMTDFLHPGARGEVTEIINKKWRGAGPGADSLIEDYASTRVRDMYSNGLFGEFESEEFNRTTGEFTKVIDPEKQQAARKAHSQVMRGLRRFLEENPQASESDVDTEIGRLHAMVSDGATIDEILGSVSAIGPDASLFGGEAVGRVTSFGYPDDPTPDSWSRKRVGAFSGQEAIDAAKAGDDHPFLLKKGDVAVSRDIEKQIRAKGGKPHDMIELTFADGTKKVVRWMDRTAETYDGKTVTGRWDFYAPDGVETNTKEGSNVVKFRILKRPE